MDNNKHAHHRGAPERANRPRERHDAPPSRPESRNACLGPTTDAWNLPVNRLIELGVDVHVTRNGSVLGKDFGNVMRIVEGHPHLAGAFAFDSMRGDVVTARDLKLFHSSVIYPAGEVVGEPLLQDLFAWLSCRSCSNLDKKLLRDAVEVVARGNTVNPIQDLLLKWRSQWDGKSRIERFLVDYLGVEDGEVAREASRVFFLSAVARAMQPGCEVQTMLVLVGKQGVGKSSTLRAICPDEAFFADSLGFPSDKDSTLSHHAYFIIEWAENLARKCARRKASRVLPIGRGSSPLRPAAPAGVVL